MARCVIYARYSSDNQREASIEDQLRICNVRAEREGWSVTATYTDAAISGATTQRPGYQAMLEVLRKGQADIVLAESLDRFSRDLEHVAAFHKLSIFAGVKIVTLAEGEISELHVGLKGTMGALYLKDLAQKTHRGLEGRARQGFGTGRLAYGYRAIRQFGPDGEPVRGLREVDEACAVVVRRIFRDYVGGASPLAIARALNAEGVPGPDGRPWHDWTIRGRPGRENGLLRNPLYVGLQVWNRTTRRRDPVRGGWVRRAHAKEAMVETPVPALRIIDDELWQQAQRRLAAEASPADQNRGNTFWDRRRPKHLLSGKVFCGCCGRAFSAVGQDYLACLAARNRQGCPNRRTVRRSTLEARVLDALGRRLMRPDLVEAFCKAFIAEWNRLSAEASSGAEMRRRELQAVERKIENLVEAISDGLKAAGVQKKLSDLEARRDELAAALSTGPASPPALLPNLAQVYAAKVAQLQSGLEAGKGQEVLEAARALIDKIIITPGAGPDDPPGIELIGHLMAMLQAGGAFAYGADETSRGLINAVSSGSAKGAMRGRRPSAVTQCVAPSAVPPRAAPIAPPRPPRSRGTPPVHTDASPHRAPRGSRGRPPARPGDAPGPPPPQAIAAPAPARAARGRG
ncbi:recombinase family protein [Roseomonas oryzicola]|uniref:Recombinase family protein n=1 Tax=Neoroseomonas oryzicola TaxID=535904 RepID=A0A9X9WPH9_9PROT|nr:recombinase family protein [Neoroseomonas oryzicola]NKE19761.1 recombinase family protein [Neoroseomonas oryzicola]